jgi:Protein of unknown function (DUF1822)
MRTDFEKSEPANMRKSDPILPQPGEIWELNRQVRFPGKISLSEEKKLYSTEAQSFLQGSTPPRYVMIVTEPSFDSQTEVEWNIVSVMVLSTETNFISDINLLIPAHISGLPQDLLAETWHVQPMLVCNLLQPVGQRVAHDIYDILLTVGDYYHGLVNQQPKTDDIERLSLKVGDTKALNTSEIDRFNQQEKAWSDVLTIPVAVYRTYIKTVNFTSQILSEQLQIDQELADFKSNHNKLLNLLSTSFNKTNTILSHWWENIFEPEWQIFSTAPLVIATRSYTDLQNTHSNSDEIAALIQQLSSGNDEIQRQCAAKQLGEIGVGNSNAIQALVSLLRSTSDDETLWVAVESLQKLDSENPAAGIRRVKIIDLGMDIAGKAVALAVALLQKIDGDASVLLQVYPTGYDNYLPPDLKLILLDNSGEILREVVSRHADICIKLKFSCGIGEKFSVQIVLDNTNFREDFVI